MSISNACQGYSAKVRLRLVIDGKPIKLAQVGPEMVILAQPMTLPICEGDVVVTVDGEEARRTVRLPDGAEESSRRVKVSTLSRES